MDTQISELFTSLLRSGKPVRIKLLGDSITHGVGGDGFAQDGDFIVGDFRRNTNGYCWAKLLKEHLEANYNCQVINNACTGTTIQFTTQFFGELTDEADDLILCTIGTNNRHLYYKNGPKPEKEAFATDAYEKILALHDKFLALGKPVIFVANIPAAPDNETDNPDAENGFWRILHMCDINDLYKKAAAERGFLFISLYDLMTDYCNQTATPLDSLLDDGLHPNNAGYRVMFTLLSQELGI